MQHELEAEAALLKQTLAEKELLRVKAREDAAKLRKLLAAQQLEEVESCCRQVLQLSLPLSRSLARSLARSSPCNNWRRRRELPCAPGSASLSLSRSLAPSHTPSLPSSRARSLSTDKGQHLVYFIISLWFQLLKSWLKYSISSGIVYIQCISYIS